MHFKRVVGLAIFVVGLVLLIFGISSTNKVKEKVVESVQGRYTETTMWYIIGGSLLIVIGGGLALTKRPL